MNITPATAGRLAGTACRHLIALERQIDWAEVGQIVLHGIVALIVLTHRAGLATGTALHRLNDHLAHRWRRLLVPEPQVSAEPAAEPIQPPAPPVMHPLALIAVELDQLTGAQLREAIGTRRRCSKAQLIGMALAC